MLHRIIMRMILAETERMLRERGPLSSSQMALLRQLRQEVDAGLL